MATNIRPLELEMLCPQLEAEFGALIQGQGADEIARKRNFYTKALQAFVLTHHVGATPAQAVAASIDGGDDHGVDAVFVGADGTVWILQSKYIDAGIGEPDLGDVHKFCDGTRDILRGNWSRFNASLQARSADLDRALNDEACRVRVVLVHTGGAISDDRRNLFGDLEHDFNVPREDLLRCESFGLVTLHDLHLDGHAADPISAELELQDFGFVAQPYAALYGRLSAQRLAELGVQHGDALVERNLRRYKGSTVVNAGLTATLQQHAADFFYFNNGVTFLCESFTEIHPRDDRRRRARFNVRGLSIINGAQTLGAIAREPIVHYAANPSEVLATFICLQNAPIGFGNEVTQYRNRQNAVDLEDFVALDDKQQHWRQTLGLAGVDYLYKQGDVDPPSGDRVFSAREAAPVLACGVGGKDWAEFVVAAKADRKSLFKKPSTGHAGGVVDTYGRVFSDTLTAKELWRTVQVGRIAGRAVRDRATGEHDPHGLAAGTLRAADVLREGRWLLLHILFIKTGLRRGTELVLTEPERQRISAAIDVIANQLVVSAQAQQWGKQARAVFENRGDCMALKASVMQAIPQAL